jgi:hypothetical protein
MRFCVSGVVIELIDGSELGKEKGMNEEIFKMCSNQEIE